MLIGLFLVWLVHSIQGPPDRAHYWDSVSLGMGRITMFMPIGVYLVDAFYYLRGQRDGFQRVVSGARQQGRIVQIPALADRIEQPVRDGVAGRAKPARLVDALKNHHVRPHGVEARRVAEARVAASARVPHQLLALVIGLGGEIGLALRARTPDQCP